MTNIRELIRIALCRIGIHTWVRSATDYTYGHPKRICQYCDKQQALFRGAGADDWMDI